jgi:hypothetical protein
MPGALAVVGSNPTGPIVILVLLLDSLDKKVKTVDANRESRRKE